MPSESTTSSAVAETVSRVWGFDTLRPLQSEAIVAALASRDALVVLPTGGGKSLCYQVPPLVAGELTVVVSPLIALMKDQVDGLVLNGYPAAAVHSGCSQDELDRASAMVADGSLRLLFVAPERLLSVRFDNLLAGMAVARFAIDEAHCISHWGHDFRPEYRQLATLRQRYPNASIQAFTATATPRVRDDIVRQLSLRDPAVHVGVFDRANLVYRVLPRVARDDQIAEILSRHQDDGAIVYCISRKDTESIAEALRARQIDARPYHAGLSHDKRRRVQENFINERLPVVVATVAFGMGIDRSNVRCIIHAALPKSVEAYQQETGRAGRDGLDAECILLHASSDAARWRRLYEMSAAESDSEPQVLQAQLSLLDEMRGFASGAGCRHKALSEHFGQAYDNDDCEACDVCLDELDIREDSTDIARKILSCIARLRLQSGLDFGAAHVADVLRGSRAKKILDHKHDQVSTHGILRDHSRNSVLSFINQLIDRGVLERSTGEYPVLVLNEASRGVLKGELAVAIVEVKDTRAPASARSSHELPLDADEHRIFEALRTLRREIAQQMGVPPYVVFGDVSLREMAAIRPGSREQFATIRGVGAQKLESFAEPFLACIATECGAIGLELNTAPAPPIVTRPSRPASPKKMNPQKALAFERFSEGDSIEQAAGAIGRALSTTAGYLIEWIERESPRCIDAWVAGEVYQRIAEAIGEEGKPFLRPIHDRLNGEVSYEQIRAVIAHINAAR